jgi:pimeloyl-ACP methyl ester carboxylesterase
MTTLIPLSDGRKLGYREFGAPNGFPVINNHGGLVCGLDIAPADEIAKRRGIRIISPDRPGIALSGAKPNRTLKDWANDVGELAAQLGLQKFALLGWSMGGQYALGCAHFLRERVTHTTIIAGALPLDDAKNFSELNHMDQRLTNMARNHPQNAELAFKAMGELAQHTPHLWNAMSARGLAKRDADALHQLPGNGLADMAAPALQTANGMVEEYRAWALPWGFTLSQIRGAVSIWQGTDDTLVPMHWAETMAREIPTARLHSVKGAGHFLALRHDDEIFADMFAA